MIKLFASLATCLLIAGTLFTQVTNTWIGGTPGQASNWNCHKNWSKYQVPDEFSDVIIPNVNSASQATPVIEKGLVRINSLMMDSGAKLNIEKKAGLVIYSHVEGITQYNFFNLGSLFILNEQSTETAGHAAALSKK